MSKKKVSRRDFIKTGAIASAGATLVGLTMGFSSLPTSKSQAVDNTAVNDTATDDTAIVAGAYVPKTRRYWLYATDGIINVPTDKFAATHREVYTYGFAKPISDTRPIGKPGPLPAGFNPIADLNWVDGSGQPIMRGKAQLTAPPIWGVEGDILEVTLVNLGFLYRSDIMDPHTVHSHGMHAPTYYDGIPEISFGIPMLTTNPPFTTSVINAHSFTYRYFCERPGTYMYHCHVEASEHVQMGMYGPLWIYPKQYGNAWTGGGAYNNALTLFNQEMISLMSEMDTDWHDMLWNPTLAVPGPDPAFANFNPVDYRPNWWLINGRSFPDTVLPGKYTAGYQPGTATTADTLLTYYPGVTATLVAGAPAGWTSPPATDLFIPRQPVQTYLRTKPGEKVLNRLLNMGFESQPMHFHGAMPTIVGKDTFAWVPQPNPMFSMATDQRMRIFTQCVCSGETYDQIVVYPNKAAISPAVWGFINETTPVPNPYSPWELDWGTIIPAVAGTPTVQTTPVPTADQPPPDLSPGFYREYPLFYLWHSHDDYKVTNNGEYPGGAVVLVRVDKTGIPPKPAIPTHLIPA